MIARLQSSWCGRCGARLVEGAAHAIRTFYRLGILVQNDYVCPTCKEVLDVPKGGEPRKVRSDA